MWFYLIFIIKIARSVFQVLLVEYNLYWKRQNLAMMTFPSEAAILATGKIFQFRKKYAVP